MLHYTNVSSQTLLSVLPGIVTLVFVICGCVCVCESARVPLQRVAQPPRTQQMSNCAFKWKYLSRNWKCFCSFRFPQIQKQCCARTSNHISRLLCAASEDNLLRSFYFNLFFCEAHVCEILTNEIAVFVIPNYIAITVPIAKKKYLLLSLFGLFFFHSKCYCLLSISCCIKVLL